MPEEVFSNDYTPGRLNGLINRCNAQINQVLPELAAAQGDYEVGHIALWQGLWSHSVPIVHGPSGSSGNGDALQNDTANKPSDRQDNWDDFLPGIKQVLPFRMLCHDYLAPQGYGYIAVFEFQLESDLFQREMQFGALGEEDSDWEYIEPDEEA